MQKIAPSLWFDDKAEEATNYYISILRTRGSSAWPATARPARGPTAA